MRSKESEFQIEQNSVDCSGDSIEINNTIIDP